MYEGADDHVANHPTIASASNANMRGPRREDHLVRMCDRIGRSIGHVNAEWLEGANCEKLHYFMSVHMLILHQRGQVSSIAIVYETGSPHSGQVPRRAVRARWDC